MYLLSLSDGRKERNDDERVKQQWLIKLQKNMKEIMDGEVVQMISPTLFCAEAVGFSIVKFNTFD